MRSSRISGAGSPGGNSGSCKAIANDSGKVWWTLDSLDSLEYGGDVKQNNRLPGLLEITLFITDETWNISEDKSPQGMLEKIVRTCSVVTNDATRKRATCG